MADEQQVAEVRGRPNAPLARKRGQPRTCRLFHDNHDGEHNLRLIGMCPYIDIVAAERATVAILRAAGLR